MLHRLFQACLSSSLQGPVPRPQLLGSQVLPQLRSHAVLWHPGRAAEQPHPLRPPHQVTRLQGHVLIPIHKQQSKITFPRHSHAKARPWSTSSALRHAKEWGHDTVFLHAQASTSNGPAAACCMQACVALCELCETAGCMARRSIGYNLEMTAATWNVTDQQDFDDALTLLWRRPTHIHALCTGVCPGSSKPASPANVSTRN